MSDEIDREAEASAERNHDARRAFQEEVPEGVPAGLDGSAPGQTPLRVGHDVNLGTVILQISGKNLNLPVASAMSLAIQIQTHALSLLLGAGIDQAGSDPGSVPPPEPGGGGLILP